MIPLPEKIKINHQNVVVMCADMCHVDGLRFLMTSISRHLHFGIIEFLTPLNHDTLAAAVQQLMNVYSAHGFTIMWILTDQAFKHLWPVLMKLNIHLNTTAANEHVE